jgi:CRP/FNR family transcriptional regulator
MFMKHEYDAHEIIFREGEPSTYLYVLRQGLLKLTSVEVSGREQIIGLATPGRILGLQTTHSRIYGFTAETLSPASVCKLRNSDMIQVLEQNPAVSLKLINMLNQELTEAQALIRVLGQKNAEERVAWFLLTLANADTRNTAYTITLWLSRREIAEMLGLTIETVSRLISLFRREGLIDVSHHLIRILNLPLLTARAKIMSESDNGVQQWVTAG